ncbi:MAG: hypothetical protein ACTSYD_06235 [Candidatus Heimdallarchaeaceae archaeon]
MAPKKEYIKWATISGYIGGIVFIVGGLIAMIDAISKYTMGQFESDMIIQTSPILNGLHLWLLALISIILGALALILINTKLNELFIGITLIVFAIIGLGIGGIFLFISGVAFIIASTKKR